MKLKLLLLSMSLCAGVAFAQAEPGAEAPAEENYAEEEIVASEGSDFEEAKSIDDLMTEFLDAKGMYEGTNPKGDSFFIVVTGVGLISAPQDNKKDYNNSRMMAFEKAMLDAKVKLSEALEVEIASAAAYSAGFASDASDAAKALAEEPKDSAVGGVVNAAAESKKTVTNEEEYARILGSATSTVVSGLSAFYTVEAEGKIGVVAIWSPKLADSAQKMVVGGETPKAKPKTPIRAQLPKDPMERLSSFGVRQMIDEKGNLVLVSFAQMGANANNPMAEKAAYDRAKLRAQAQIREFAGEVAKAATIDYSKEGLKAYEDGSMDYSNEEAYMTNRQTAAAALKLNGIAQAAKWKVKHPVSGKFSYIVVCTWSSANAVKAREMKKIIEETAKDGAAGKRRIKDPVKKAEKPRRKNAPKAPVDEAPTATQEEHMGFGAAGDDDAF